MMREEAATEDARRRLLLLTGLKDDLVRRETYSPLSIGTAHILRRDCNFGSNV